MKATVAQLVLIVKSMEPNTEINFSQFSDSDYWGIKKLNVFDGEVILMGYYGGNCIASFNSSDIEEEEEELHDFITGILESSAEDHIYLKFPTAGTINAYLLNAELGKPIVDSNSSNHTQIKQFFQVIKHTDKSSDFGILWAGDTRNDPTHKWYESQDCVSILKSIKFTLKHYHIPGHYFGILNDSYGYWHNEEETDDTR